MSGTVHTEQPFDDADVVMRFPGPPPVIDIGDDSADEYVIEKCQEACQGFVIYGKYTKYRDKPEWVANPFARPVVRHLMDRVAALEALIRHLNFLCSDCGYLDVMSQEQRKLFYEIVGDVKPE